MGEYRPKTHQRKQMSEKGQSRTELRVVWEKREGAQDIASSVPNAAPRDMGCRSLFPGLIFGLQPRFVGLDELAKLGGVGEQRVPLLQV